MKKKPRAMIGNISVWCSHDKIVNCIELKPNPKNPNTHPASQIALLGKIITEQGWRAPITVSNRSGLIVKGHGRLEAALMAGILKAPVDLQDYESEAVEHADMVADNRLSELAEINDDKLSELLAELNDFDIDMDLTGFDDVALGDIILQDSGDEKSEMDKIETLKPDKIIEEKIKHADKVIYQFSGGRDSMLAILKTIELVRDKDPVACYVDTGTELPDLLYFIYNFYQQLDLPLKILRPKHTFFEIYGKNKTFPDPIFRECVFNLINQPTDKIFFSYKNALVIRGGRKKQKTTRSNANVYQEITRSKNKIIKLLNPLFTLTDDEFGIDLKNIYAWPGYNKGFDRTACWCCPFQKGTQWEALKKYYPFLWDNMEEMSKTWKFKEYKGDGNIKRFRKYWGVL